MAEQLSIEQVALDAIHPAPWNVRCGHDVQGIADSIRVNGFRDPIEVWRRTGEIVVGEGRWHGARALGLATVPVIYHEFDSLAAAKRYAIANNRLTDQSRFDEEALADQLSELAGLGELEGSGFDEAELAKLTDVGGVADGEPPADNYVEQYAVIVVCSDEAHQQTVYEQLLAQGYACKVVVT